MVIRSSQGFMTATCINPVWRGVSKSPQLRLMFSVVFIGVVFVVILCIRNIFYEEQIARDQRNQEHEESLSAYHFYGSLAMGLLLDRDPEFATENFDRWMLFSDVLSALPERDRSYCTPGISRFHRPDEVSISFDPDPLKVKVMCVIDNCPVCSHPDKVTDRVSPPD